MRVIAIGIAVSLVVGCKDDGKRKPIAKAAPAAVDPTVAAARDTFLRIFSTDEEVLSGRRSAPRTALASLCAARAQNVASVLESQCNDTPLADRSVAELKKELDKTQFAIAIASKVANDTTQPAKLRDESKAALSRLEQEKAALEQLIAEKEKGAGAVKPKLPPGVRQECVDNPLAAGCS